MSLARVVIPTLITGAVGLALVLAVFVPAEPFATLDENFSNYFNVIQAFAFVLGGGNLLRHHMTKLSRHGEEKFFAAVTLIGFAVMLIAGSIKLRTDFSIDAAGEYDAAGTMFRSISSAVFDPCSSAMFSLLGFFVASASYRAFRARTKEATLLLLAASVILLGRTPLGPFLTSWLPETLDWLKVENLSNWIMSVPNLAGQRAILIGIALGVVSTSLKLILGLERSHLSGEN